MIKWITSLYKKWADAREKRNSYQWEAEKIAPVAPVELKPRRAPRKTPVKKSIKK